MLRASEYETIAVEITDGVATLTLNRPEHGNSVDDRMHSELATIFTDVRRTKDVHAVVLTGAGTSFCSGGDSSPTRKFETFTGLTPIDEARTIIETLIDLDQPLVAAVNGDARGLGAILATFADAAFIARTAQIGDAHVRGGVTAGNGSAALWPLLIGLNASKELLLGGRIIDAEEAVRLGLVREAVDEAEVLPRAQALAAEWASLPTLALQTTKRALNVHLKTAVAQVLPFALALEEQTLAPLMEARRRG
jgi:enoyl-CoA hydratase/carnithine racemase